MQYKITRVSEQEPKPVYSEKWKSTTYYIKVQLEGVERPVEIGKKKPDALSVGMTVDGTILPKPDFPADGFKADPIAPPNSSYSGTAAKSTYQPKDEEAIARAVALKAAVELHATTDEKSGKAIIETANGFLAWLKERPEAPKDDEPHHEPIDEGF